MTGKMSRLHCRSNFDLHGSENCQLKPAPLQARLQPRPSRSSSVASSLGGASLPQPPPSPLAPSSHGSQQLLDRQPSDDEPYGGGGANGVPDGRLFPGALQPLRRHPLQDWHANLQ